MRQRIPLETSEDELDDVLHSARQDRLERGDFGDRQPRRIFKRPLKHIAILPPRDLTLKQRVKHVASSLALIAYGVSGVVHGSLYNPGKSNNGLHLKGIAMWVGFAAIVFAALHYLSLVVNHYDKRDNQLHYRRFAKITKVTGFTLLFLSFLAYAFLEP